jgi:hypothetical protein
MGRVYFRDHELHPIAVGELLADARRELEMEQQPLVPPDNRLPLPALVALDILHVAAWLRDTITWKSSSLPFIHLFRASLAVGVNCTFFVSPKPASAFSQATSP